MSQIRSTYYGQLTQPISTDPTTLPTNPATNTNTNTNTLTNASFLEDSCKTCGRGATCKSCRWILLLLLAILILQGAMFKWVVSRT